MDEPQPYQWDFDRESITEMLGRNYETFSVGVFQWVPKASGKGLKRTRTIVRVMGYTADSQRAIKRAEELCQQLNKSNSRADHPPAWLQKQYSVPRPAEVPVRVPRNRMPPSHARAIREQVMKHELLPLKFIKGPHATYIRQRGEQIHMIYFDAYGGDIRVDIAFHYTFVPPLFHMEKIPVDKLEFLDFMLESSADGLEPGAKRLSYEYGFDRDALRQALVRAAAESVLHLDRHAELWADPARVLSLFKAEKCALWGRRDRELVIACLEMRLGLLDEARQTLDRWLAACDLKIAPSLYKNLIARLDNLRATGVNAPGGLGELNWFSA